MKRSIVYDKAFKFAIKTVKVYKYLCRDKREFILSKQVLRAGTSIGANIKEGTFAQSKKDFLSKMNIALKECSETVYWLELLSATGYLDTNESEVILSECTEINKILIAIVKTTKRQLRTEKTIKN